MIKEWTENTIHRLHKEGRGQGAGADYQPWIKCSDFSSSGKSRTVWGLKTPRIHHLFSQHEFDFFLCAEWSDQVVDIQEQFPLDREVSQEIAQRLRINHPHYPTTHVPCVMTVDFLLTMQRDDGELYPVAFNIKTDSAAEDRRNIDKLEIQRAYFAAMGITHHLIFDSSIPKGVCSNLRLLRDKIQHEKEDPTTYAQLSGLKDTLASWLKNIKGADMSRSASVLCTRFDELYALLPGTSLRVLAMLFFERSIQVNLHVQQLFEGEWEYLTMPPPKAAQSILRKAA